MKRDLNTKTIKETLRKQLKEAGAVAVGFARTEEVSEQTVARFETWLADGCNGELKYMHNYPELRFDPRGLLPEATTMISVAWPYLPRQLRDPSLPFIARYAYAPDYHKSIRTILKPLLKAWQNDYGFHTRVCIDSAPLLERYWAVMAGVGFTGLNGCLIVPGYGSWVYLTEILIDTELTPDSPCTQGCAACGACLKACPSSALRGDGTLDCRRCWSALTVESPGAITSGSAHDRPLAGCDRCQEVCPHNRAAVPHDIPAFATPPGILTLDAEEIQTMTPADFDRRFATSALKRLGLSGLRQNLKNIH